MKRNKSRQNFKALLTLLFAFTLTLVMALTAACGNAESSSESASESSSATEEETPTDTQTLTNGDFEFYASSGFPVSGSSTKWTKSTDSGIFSGKASSATSGIIDTADSAYASLASSHKPTENGETGETAINPRTPTYNGNDEVKDVADTEVNEAGTKILMIHNKSSVDGLGAAQYYKNSTTLSLAATEYAKLSVWVRTDNLKSLQSYDKYGAYVKLVNKVNSEIAPLVIKNINTEGKWVNYVIYLAPSNIATTSYQVVLGLGMGDQVHTEELCEGFAYFDNIEYGIITEEEFNAATCRNELALYVDNVDVTGENPNAFLLDEYATVYGDEPTAINVKLDFAKAEDVLAIGGNGKFNDVHPTNEGDKVNDKAEDGYEAGLNQTAGKTISIGKDKTEEVDENAVFMNFQGKVGSSYTYATNSITVPSKSYFKVSFDAKVSAKDSSTNASAILVDGEKDSSAAFTDFTTEGDGYTKYTFFVANEFDSESEKYADKDLDLKFSLKLSFGPTSRASTVWDLPVGYAIFKNFTITELTADEYASANTSDSHAVKVSLQGDFAASAESEEESSSTDYDEIKESYSFSINDAYFTVIEKGALPLSQFTTAYRAVNYNEENAVVGLVNSYFDYDYAGLNEALDALEENASTNYVQPLMIYNTAETHTGVVGNSISLAANSSYTFSLKVKTVNGAKAYIYLVNTAVSATSEAGEQNYPIYTFATTDNAKYDNISKELFTVVESDTEDYVNVIFYLRTGKDALNVRLEVYNGARDGKEDSQGIVLVDSIANGSSSGYSLFEDLAANYSTGEDYFNALKYNQGEIYSYKGSYAESNVVYDDNNKKVSEPAEDYVVYAESKNGLVKFLKADVLTQYNIVEDEDAISEEESSESEEESESNNESTVGNLVWLQITSIIIAAVLIAVLVIIIVRKSLEKKNKRKEQTRSYYVGYDKSSRKVPSKHDIEAPDEDDGEYDYGDGDKNE